MSDWVGLGDAVDVFELNFEQNGVVSFEWNDSAEFGKDALASGDISLALVNANGEKVALAFDKGTGIYSTTTVLMADADYYLSVQNKKPSQNSIDYKIDISLA